MCEETFSDECLFSQHLSYHQDLKPKIEKDTEEQCHEQEATISSTIKSRCNTSITNTNEAPSYLALKSEKGFLKLEKDSRNQLSKNKNGPKFQSTQPHIIMCVYCDQNFLNENEFSGHRCNSAVTSNAIDIVHQNTDSAPNYSNDLKVRPKLSMQSVSKFECIICHKKFANETEYAYHLNDHRKPTMRNKLSQCSTCIRKFLHRDNLPLQCDICVTLSGYQRTETTPSLYVYFIVFKI